MKNYIYCVREQAIRENESVYFKIGHANDLDRRKSSMQTANRRPLRFVFVLGPFLCRNEAEDVESQVHSLLSKYRIRGEWFEVNPLAVPDFWDWIDAQILPICVHEKSAIPQFKDRKLRGQCIQWQRRRQKYGTLTRRKEPDQGSLDLS